MRRTAQGGRTRIPAWLSALIMLLVLCSCGGGGGGSQSTSGNPAGEDSGSLNLTLRATDSVDGTLSVELLADNAAGLYQLSSRLTYNPAAVRPLGPAVAGNLISPDAVFYSNDRQASFVPVAFTNRNSVAISQPGGRLFSLQFEVLDSSADPQFNINRDAEYLIARDNAAGNLALQIEVQK